MRDFESIGEILPGVVNKASDVIERFERMDWLLRERCKFWDRYCADQGIHPRWIAEYRRLTDEFNKVINEIDVKLTLPE